MATELYIKPYGGTSYSLVDLEATIPLPYTYNILDIRNPDKRNANWSKTLRIPGTKDNNILFEYIFEAGISGGFNPNKKAEVYVLQDSLPVIPSGILQLVKITRDNQNLDRIYYECAITGGIEDIFTVMGEASLNELDLSEYDHDYTSAVQVASWSAAIGEGYVYPMIDYNGRERLDQYNYEVWRVDEFFPAIYAKTFIDKIFDFAGKTYTSGFFDSDFFKRIIIPYSFAGYKFNAADIEAREFRVELSAMQDNVEVYPTMQTGIVAFDNDSSGTAYDASNIFNTTTHVATIQAAKDGYYAFEIGGEIDFMFTEASSASMTVGGSGGNYTIAAGLQVIKGSSQLLEAVNNLQNVQSGDVFTSGSAVLPQYIQIRRNKVYLKEGETIKVVIYTYYSNGFSLSGSATVTSRLAAGAYLKCEFINEFAEGMGIAMNSCIPDIKMKDFFKAIVQAFHLHIEEDKYNAKNLYIEPRDSWYSTDVIDWSAKLDYEKGLEIVPMADLQGSKYVFRYKTDRDYWNTYYQKDNHTYGERIIDVDNDFVKQEVVNELAFSPTPSRSPSYESNRVVPMMYSLNSNAPEHKETNIRMLYWGGLKNYTGSPWARLNGLTGTQTTMFNTYPYAGHLDDPYNPTLDLNFGMPKEVQWLLRGENYTDNNLYNKYHRRFIEEITDVDARLVTGYFLLTPLDIFNLSFQKLYFFHNELYHLNKIIDYDLAEYKLVKCEFVKVKDPGVYAASTLPIYGGGDSVWDGNVLPDVALPKTHNGNTYDNIHVVVTGKENYISKGANGIMVVGNENFVGAGAQNILIQGSSNVIYPGVTDVALIQTNGITVTESNTTYINGCQVSGCVATVGGGGG